MKVMAALLLIAAGPQAERAASAPRPAPTRPGLSWAAADALEAKLLDIERKAPKARRVGAEPRSVEVTESELNSYLNLTLAPRSPLSFPRSPCASSPPRSRGSECSISIG
jgi:hypothetical protein